MKFSFFEVSLKRRILVAIALVTLLPLITLLYYFNNFYISLAAILVIVVIIFLGWWIIFETFLSIRRLSSKSKEAIADLTDGNKPSGLGDVKNEAQQLDSIFDILSKKAKDNLEELRIVSSQTEKLNQQINQKVNILSSILQANSSLIKGIPADEIFQFLTDKLKDLVRADSVTIIFKKFLADQKNLFFSGLETSQAVTITKKEHALDIFQLKERCVSTGDKGQFNFLKQDLGWANFIINPIKVKEKTVGGIIVHCSHNNLFFHNNDFEVIDLFSYNLGVIWERERLSRKVEDLETIDPLTGILKKKTFLSKLKAELDRSRVYQRPCGLVVASLQDYPQANNFIGPEKTEEIMQEIVKVCKDNIRPIDILGRLDSRQIGIILIERNRRQCNYVRIRIKDLIYNFLKEFEPSRIKAEVVVAESPIDGTEAPQLLRCVNSQLKEQ